MNVLKRKNYFILFYFLIKVMNVHVDGVRQCRTVATNGPIVHCPDDEYQKPR
jgi:hypothetical protein